jgi:hypothetical protein
VEEARLDCVLDPMLDQVCCRNIKRLAGNEAQKVELFPQTKQATGHHQSNALGNNR